MGRDSRLALRSPEASPAGVTAKNEDDEEEAEEEEEEEEEGGLDALKNRLTASKQTVE